MAVDTDHGGGETERSRASEKTAFFNDPKVRGTVIQVILIALLIYAGWSIVQNTAANLAAQGKAFGFDFLNNAAGFDVNQTLIDYGRESSFWRVYFVGLLNTLLVAILGIIIATFLGFTIGVARLSKNWIVSKAAYLYVEALRNIPLLLWIFIFYFGVLRLLPEKKNPLFAEFDGALGFLSVGGWIAPKPIAGELFWLTGAAFLIGIVGSLLVSNWARKRQFETGQQFPVGWASLGLIIGMPLVVFLASGLPLTFELPKMARFGPSGGMSVIPEFIALLTALSIYTSAFIAEIVRAGILAINKGQTEAAYALGLRAKPTLNLVIIPQALRVIIPPLTNQFLNLTKNSSLAVAIAYPELVSIFAGTSLNQSGRAVEIIIITMLTYLTLSLMTSSFMNWYNNRMALVER
ncbi:MAG: amino acid ABC transporter permease [Rhizobiales bacterium]|nr:amino acid ABC transporter permease [Hyphomicrobiales bacterium]